MSTSNEVKPTFAGIDIGASSNVATQEEQGTVIQINDPTDEPVLYGDGKPVTIRVAGTYSARYRNAQAANRDKLIKRRAAFNGNTVSKQALDVTAACVIEWDGFFSGGKPFPCTHENVVALLESCPWIRDQVESAMNDHALYFKKVS